MSVGRRSSRASNSPPLQSGAAASAPSGEVPNNQNIDARDARECRLKAERGSYGKSFRRIAGEGLRRSRLFGQLPGRNKLKIGSRLLVSPLPEIKFILCCCGVL